MLRHTNEQNALQTLLNCWFFFALVSDASACQNSFTPETAFPRRRPSYYYNGHIAFTANGSNQMHTVNAFVCVCVSTWVWWRAARSYYVLCIVTRTQSENRNPNKLHRMIKNTVKRNSNWNMVAICALGKCRMFCFACFIRPGEKRVEITKRFFDFWQTNLHLKLRIQLWKENIIINLRRVLLWINRRDNSAMYRKSLEMFGKYCDMHKHKCIHP